MASLEPERILAFALLMVAGQFSPGPDMLLLLKNSLAYRRRAGLFTVLGISTGIFIHVIVVLSVLGTTIKNYPALFTWVTRVGAVYLAYLGAKLLWSLRTRGNGSGELKRDAEVLSDRGAFMQGFLTNITNAKAVIFFSALLPGFLGQNAPLAAQAVYGGIIFGQALLFWSLFVCILQLDPVSRGYRKMERPLNLIFGILLLFAAFQAFTSAGSFR